MDKRRFIINLSANILSAISGILVSFLLTPFIVKELGKEAYGFYPLASNFAVYIGIITTAVNSMFGRYVLISLEKKESHKINEYFSTVFLTNIVFAIVIGIGSFTFLYFLNDLLDVPINLSKDIGLLFLFTFISLIITLLGSVFSIIGFILNRLEINAIRKIIGDTINIILLLFLFYYFVPKIYFLGVSVMVMSLYLLIANFLITKKLLPDISIKTSLFRKELLVILIGAGIWNSIMGLSDAIFFQLDLLIANTKFGATEMGELALTKQFPALISMLAAVIIPVFIPTFIKNFANGNDHELKKNINFSFKFSSVILLIPLGFIMVFADVFYSLWTPNENSSKLGLLLILSLSKYVVQLTIEPIFSIYITLNKIRIPSLWAVFTAILNLVLVLLLIEYTSWGVFAIPIAALIIGNLSHLTFSPLYAAKILNYSPWIFYKIILQGLFVLAITVSISYIGKMILPFSYNWGTLFLTALICGTGALLFSFAIIFNKQQISNVVSLFKSKIL